MSEFQPLTYCSPFIEQWRYTVKKQRLQEENEMMSRKSMARRPQTAEEGLRFLAVWFDAMYPDDPDTQVQDDLRKWAAEIERLRAENAEMTAHIQECHNSMIDLTEERDEAREAARKAHCLVRSGNAVELRKTMFFVSSPTEEPKTSPEF